MSDSDPIDLSHLQQFNLRPDWVEDLEGREGTPGEVVWGRVQDSGDGPRGRGPRREGGGRPFDRQDRGPRGPRDDRRGPPGQRPDNRGPRPEGRGPDNRGPRPDNRGPRPGGPDNRGPRPDNRGPRPEGRGPDNRGPRPEGRGPDNRGPRPDHRGPREGGRPDQRRDFRGGPPQRQFDGPPPSLPGWQLRLLPETKALEAVTRQIKASGRAYAVFSVGRLFMAGRDRYVAEFRKAAPPQPDPKAPAGETPPPPPPVQGPQELFLCPADQSLWLTRAEAVHHLLHSPARDQWYRQETVEIAPPKGNFTAIAVCGFSGTLLGPPNHHAFQSNVARLHRERFAHMALDRYKSRIRTEKDEAVLAKWQEMQTRETRYIPVTEAPAPAAAEAAPAEEPPAGIPAEPAAEAAEVTDAAAAEAPVEAVAAEAPEPAPEAATAEATPEGEAPAAEPEAAAPAEPEVILRTAAELEAHFLKHHAAKAIRAVNRAIIPGNIAGKLLSAPLLDVLRFEVDSQQRYPMQLVQDLCRSLERQHLKFFKRDRKATFVCRTRPHFIQNEESLSERIRSILGIVRANPGITYTRLVSTLAPHLNKPAAAADVGTPVVEIAEPAAPGEVAPAAAEESPAPAPGVEAAPAAEVTPAPEVPAGEPASENPAGETPSAEPAATPAAEAPVTDAPAAAPAPAAEPAAHLLSPEEIAILQDLRWLVQEGYVTEFEKGELEILGRAPQPPAEKKPKKERERKPKKDGTEAAPATAEGEASAAEGGEAPVAEISPEASETPAPETAADASPAADAPAEEPGAAAPPAAADAESAPPST